MVVSDCSGPEGSGALRRAHLLSRRATLRLLFVAGTGGLLAACTSAAPAAPSKPAAPAAPAAAPAASPAASGATPAAKSAAPAVKGAASKATLRLDFLATSHHTPFYLAIQRGFFAEQGLDLQIMEGSGSANAVRAVGSGADTFGIASMPPLGLAIAEGVPAKSIFSYIQKAPDSILYLPESGIKTPKDLNGKSFAYTPGSSGETLFPAFAAAVGIDESSINKVTVEVTAKLTTLLQNKADFTVLWDFNDVPVSKSQGKEASYFSYADHGVNALGHQIAASQNTIRNNPDLIKAFVLASTQGIEAAVKNQEEAVDALMSSVQGRNRALLLEQVKGLESHLHTTSTAGKALGWSSPEDLKQTLDLMLKYMGLKKELSPDDVYTAQFIPA